MLFIPSAWAVLFILMLCWGIGTYRLLVKLLGPRFAKIPGLFQIVWLGYATLIGFLQLYSILFPIDSRAALTAIFIAFVVALFSFKYLSQIFLRFSAFSISDIIVRSAGILILSLVVASNACLPLRNYDSNLYHLNAVKWISTYPTVPGLANLHGRLAFNSSFHVFAAFTNVGMWKDKAVYVANSFLLLLVVLEWFTLLFKRAGQSLKLTNIFALLTAPFIIHIIFESDTSSLSSDLPMIMVSLVLIRNVFSVNYRRINRAKTYYNVINRRNFFTWILIVALSSVVLSTKLSAAALAIPIFMFSLLVLTLFSQSRCFPYSRFRHFLVLYALPIVIMSGLIMRYIILSGWLIYPFPIGNLNLDWSVSRMQVFNEINSIRSWARMPYTESSKVLANGFLFWFIPWFKTFTAHKNVLMLLFLGLVGLAFLFFSPDGKSFRSSKSYTLLLAIAVSILSLIYWFFSAPDVRFGEIFFWLFGATSLSPLIYFLIKKYKQTFLIMIVVILVLFFKVAIAKRNAFLFARTHLLSLPLSESKVTELITIKNGQTPPLSIYKPVSGNQCGNSLLPCSPYITETSNIEQRVPGILESGFRRNKLFKDESEVVSQQEFNH